MGVAAGESLVVDMVEMEEAQNYHKRVQIVHHVTPSPLRGRVDVQALMVTRPVHMNGIKVRLFLSFIKRPVQFIIPPFSPHHL